MAQMPHAAFEAECRVPENAERLLEGLSFSPLAGYAFGII